MSTITANLYPFPTARPANQNSDGTKKPLREYQARHGDQLSFAGKKYSDSTGIKKAKLSRFDFTNALTAPLEWISQRRQDNDKLKKMPTTLDLATLRHELGHALVSMLSSIPHSGLVLTPPDMFGAELQRAQEPSNADELLKHLVMRMAGLAGDKTIPHGENWTEKHWNQYLHAQSAQDFADIVELLNKGSQKGWLTISMNKLPTLDIKRFHYLNSLGSENLTLPQKLEYTGFVEKLDQVASFPIVKEAIDTAQRIYHGVPEQQIDQLTQGLAKQSYFEHSALKKLMNQHITSPQKERINIELEEFVHKYKPKSRIQPK